MVGHSISFRWIPAAAISAGRWNDDTLVVETTHVSAPDPTGGGVYRGPIPLTDARCMIERFTLLAPSEILYRRPAGPQSDKAAGEKKRAKEEKKAASAAE